MLSEFYRNEAMREAVKEYLTNFFSQEAVKRVFAREDVSHIADAQDLMLSAFDNLELLYARKRKKEITEEAV